MEYFTYDTNEWQKKDMDGLYVLRLLEQSYNNFDNLPQIVKDNSITVKLFKTLIYYTPYIWHDILHRNKDVTIERAWTTLDDSLSCYVPFYIGYNTYSFLDVRFKVFGGAYTMRTIVRHYNRDL